MNNLFAPVQATIRRALEFDPDTAGRIGELDGRIVEIVFTGIEQSLCVSIHEGSVLLSRIPAREPDLRLKGTPIAFARYIMAPERAEITESGLKIDGDVGLAQRFVDLLRRLDIDWEEWVSRYVGDVVAYRAGRVAESFRAWARNSTHQVQQDVTEYLQEEIRLLAPRERVQRLMNDIDATHSDVERLAQRIERLQSKL